MLSVIVSELIPIFKISSKTVPIDPDLRSIIQWLREYNYCKNTFITYRVIILRFYLWLKYNGLTLELANKYHLLSYSEFIKTPDPSWCNIHRQRFNHLGWRPFQKSLSNTSVHSNLVVIKNMFTYLYHANILSHNPFWFKIRNYDITCNSLVKQSRYFTKEEFQLLIDFIEKMPIATIKLEESKVRILWVFKLLFFTACRKMEVINATMENIKFINRRLWLEVIGKGNKIGYIPIIPELAIALNEYRKFYDLPTLDKRTVNESHIPLIILHKKSNHYSPISPSHLWYLVKSTCILFTETIKDQTVIEKIKKVSPHWFRHSSATAQVNSGIDIRVVQQNLRHSSIETTMRYQHIDNDARHQATINFGSRIKTVDK